MDLGLYEIPDYVIELAWVGRDLKNHLVPAPLQGTQMSPTRSGCLGNCF